MLHKVLSNTSGHLLRYQVSRKGRNRKFIGDSPSSIPNNRIMSQRKLIADLVAQKHQTRPIGPDAPQPIEITVTSTGPLSIDRGSVLCDICGSIIRQSYLPAHRSTGACARAAERRKQSNDENLYQTTQTRTVESCSVETDRATNGAT